MKSYVLTNRGGDLVLELINATGAEPNIPELGTKFDLRPAKRSFIQLHDGQDVVLRALSSEPSAA